MENSGKKYGLAIKGNSIPVQNSLFGGRVTALSLSLSRRSALYDNPDNAKVHYNYANFLKDSHRNDEAIEHYRLALKYAPEHASSNNNLGTLLGDNPEVRL